MSRIRFLSFLILLPTLAGLAIAQRNELITAVRKGDAQWVKALIAAKADVNAAEDGRTALMWASGGLPVERHADIVRMLIDAGADVNAVDNELGSTALMWASGDGYTDIVRMLIDAKANLNAADKDGKTALMGAADKGYTDIVWMLKEAEAK